MISRYLKTLEKDLGWTKKELERIRRKYSSFLLKDCFFWQRTKVVDEVSLKIVEENSKKKILQESHDAKATRY
jgi:hypothetical protein